MKSAGKARNDGLYRHIRTSKEIIRNLLNDFINIIPFLIIKYNENNPKIATTAISAPLIIAISFYRANYQNQI